MNLTEIKGAVAEGASHIEYVIHVLLRFLCQAVYREAPELHFRDQLDNDRPISRQSLGKLGELLEALAEELQRDRSPRAVQFERDFATHRLAPEGGLGGLPRLRNAFAHFDREMNAVPLDAARRLASEFFQLALAFLDHLGRRESRVFPIVVRIERLQVDRWGRRIVEAVSDEEDPDELIFTDGQLLPGQLYFMHPLSNPIRVDPILVAAGDLEGRADAAEPGRRSRPRLERRSRGETPG